MKRRFAMHQLDKYRAGTISLGALAETLDLSMIETLNLVGAYHAHPVIPKDYLMEAHDAASHLFKPKRKSVKNKKSNF